MILSIATGVEWLEFIVILMIDMLNFVQALTGFSDLLMGMTILGISNSFVDLFIDRALAIQGYEILAITGLFAGQMFNFLAGFGLSAMVKWVKGMSGGRFHLYKAKKIFQTHDKDQMLTFGILISCFVCLTTLLIRLPITK